jgi:protein gp37
MSGIEWTDKTWNPIRGCSRVSPGCENCYAEAMAYRFSKEPDSPFNGLVKATSKGPRWTNEVKFVAHKLNEPFSWRKPRLVFVNSMSDFFHEKIPTAVKTMIWDVMVRNPQHKFQVLTKRPLEMKKFLKLHGTNVPSNIWLGISVENQEMADLRIPVLLDLPVIVPVKFLSVEPLIGPVDLTKYLDQLEWVIVGGESGPNARFCEISWIERIVDDCNKSRATVFVKQLGKGHDPKNSKGGDIETWPETIRVRQYPI